LRTIRWDDGAVVTIDQTQLPAKLVFLKLKTCSDVAKAIKSMRIRGAPLIGAAAALGLALTASQSKAKDRRELIIELRDSAILLKSTRPTAVNLAWAVDQVVRRVGETRGAIGDLKSVVLDEALEIAESDAQTNRRLGRAGAKLLEDGDTVLTHCNAGALATVEYGTALGVIRAAVEEGKKIKVIATETRPLLQGARLTAFELINEGIPVTLITDGMAAYVMKNRMVDKVIVGADRVLRSGHVYNKIGTLSLAVLAKAYSLPFYVAAPTSTIDLDSEPDDVVIEQRDPREILFIYGQRIAPDGVKVLNPAFDLTPPEYVTAIITEEGVFPPKAVRKALEHSE